MRKRKHRLTAAKARLMLREGSIRGKPLTAKQKRYFGCVASGHCKPK